LPESTLSVPTPPVLRFDMMMPVGGPFVVTVMFPTVPTADRFTPPPTLLDTILMSLFADWRRILPLPAAAPSLMKMPAALFVAPPQLSLEKVA
jgi:hypothetical protein